MPPPAVLSPQDISLIAVDRAIRELRAGLPVLLWSESEQLLIQAVENSLNAPSPEAVLLLSAERATTLGLPRKAVRLHIDGLSDGNIAALADPTFSASPSEALQPLKSSDASASDILALQLAKLAEILPALWCQPLQLPDDMTPERWAAARGYLTCLLDAVRDYRHRQPDTLMRVSEAQVPIEHAGTFTIIAFRPKHGGHEHLALVAGEPQHSSDPVPIRLHSSCLTGDILGSLRCDCGEQLRKAIQDIGQAGCGVVLYLNQEGRGIGIANKLKAYQLQDDGSDTFDANELLGYGQDERDFGIAAAILKQLGIETVRLMTNNPRKIKQLEAHGIIVAERLAHHVEANEVNAGYLESKRSKGGHLA